jgi:hypothetical protein
MHGRMGGAVGCRDAGGDVRILVLLIEVAWRQFGFNKVILGHIS